MGLDAFVPCNCWPEGKTTPPPIDKSLLTYEEGILSVVDDEPFDIDEWSERERLLNQWLPTCCPHPELEYFGERIGNWAAVRVFQGLVRQCQTHLSVLLNLLPNGNGGEMPPALAPEVLNELDIFEREIIGAPAWFLINQDTGQELWDYVPSYGGQLGFGPEIGYGFDPKGLFVIESKTGKEIFRAETVIQTVLEKTETHKLCRWAGTNGQEITSRAGFGDSDCTLSVICRPLTIEDIPCATEIRKLAEASLATGNPIYWC